MQVVVDLPGKRVGVRDPVTRHPHASFGAVIGHGADHEDDLVDQLSPGRQVEQRRQPGGLPVAFRRVTHPDAGVDDGGGDRPRPGGVVLDDRDPGLRRADRGPIVDLHSLQHPR